jgi:hypothetical protein
VTIALQYGAVLKLPAPPWLNLDPGYLQSVMIRTTVAEVGPAKCRVAFEIPTWAPFHVPVCRAALRRLHKIALVADAD